MGIGIQNIIVGSGCLFHFHASILSWKKIKIRYIQNCTRTIKPLSYPDFHPAPLQVSNTRNNVPSDAWNASTPMTFVQNVAPSSAVVRAAPSAQRPTTPGRSPQKSMKWFPEDPCTHTAHVSIVGICVPQGLDSCPKKRLSNLRKDEIVDASKADSGSALPKSGFRRRRG
jgi:hypothetical protein